MRIFIYFIIFFTSLFTVSAAGSIITNNILPIINVVSTDSVPMQKPHAIKILKMIRDNRGFTSIIFMQNYKIWGLDFLTKHELDSLKRL